MNVPYGRVLTMRYCSIEGPQQAQVPATKGPQGDMGVDALEVVIRAPDGETYEHHLPNGEWSINNPTVQLMGFINVPPTAFDGQSVDIRDKDILVPLVTDEAGTYHIRREALVRGAERLEELEWMETPDEAETEPVDAQSDREDLSNDVVQVDIGNQEHDN